MKQLALLDEQANRTPAPTLDDFVERLRGAERPVILLEGTRELPPSDRPALVALARLLANRLPSATFRTGGAAGSDDAFAEGVRAVDPRRIEYVLPQPEHRSCARHSASPTYSLDDLDDTRLRFIADRTATASPKYGSMTRYFIRERDNSALSIKTRYLLRDTLKVAGSPEQGLRPAAAGLFYVNEADPLSGGTGHTIRVSQRTGIPVFYQCHWRAWVAAGGSATDTRSNPVMEAPIFKQP